jgi:RNA polymerase sigma-70 factor (sigma-E family)
VQPVPEFGDFVATRSTRLLRVAYLLTRDWALAEDLLQTALAKAWSAWRRIESDPEAYVRRILVTTYSSWWRRPWLHEWPTGELPEATGVDEHRQLDDRDEMLQALGRLPHRQRAVLVLRYYEDLSEAEIAETLGIAPGTVKSLAATGVANLRTDLLFGDEPSAHHVRLAAVTERVKMRRRRAIAVVCAACAMVIAVIIGYVVSPAHRSDRHPQPLTTASPREIGGLPEYYLGTHVVHEVTLSVDHPRDQMTFTPSPHGGLLLTRCQMTTRSVTVNYTVSDQDSTGGLSCTADFHVVQRREQFFRTVWGTTITTPMTLTVELQDAYKPGGERVAIPPDFSLIYAVADNVEWSDYVFPTPPAELPRLAEMLAVNTTKVASDPADPMAPRTVRIRRPAQLGVLADGTGPTRLHIKVDGVEVLDFRKWSYDPTPGPEHLKSDKTGSIVTLTITPEYATGPWVVELVDECGVDRCPVLTP